jgi:Xaa-Pro aminopeptidase
MTAGRSITDERLVRLRARLHDEKLAALVIVHVPNVRYLTGFEGSSAAVVVTDAGLWFITDGRYHTEADSLAAAWTGARPMHVVRVTRTYDDALADVLRERAVTRIGVEASHLSVARFRWLQSALAGETSGAGTGRPELVPVENLVEDLRQVKDDHEVALLRKASAILTEVAPAIFRLVRPGRTEREVAAAIVERLLAAGFERPAFEPIVAGGTRSALPHARTSSRALGPGDVVLLDFGGVYDGYFVDFSRTVRLGAVDPEAWQLHAAVRGAQGAALDAIRPGQLASEIDGAARNWLADAGYGDSFVHATGHGLGLELHERPRLGRRMEAGPYGPAPPDAVLVPGMVVTVEPGAYVPGRAGVRIEDDVLVTESGCEILTGGVSREFLDVLEA